MGAPDGWTLTRLVDHFDLPEKQVDPRRFPYRDWPLVAPDHIEGETGRLLHVETAREQNAISGKYPFRKGDVLYSKIRPYLRKAVLAPFDGLCSADMYPLRPRVHLDPRFLLAIVLGEEFSRFATAVSMRSGFPKINREELSEFSTHLPPVEEQRRIADILDTADDTIRQTERLIAKLRQVKAGLLHDLLTRGIDEQGRLRDPVVQPEQFKEELLGRIPKNWKVSPMGELATRIVDGIHHTPSYVEEGVPFLTVENLTASSSIDFLHCRRVSMSDHRMFSRRAAPRPGDVLVTKDGTLGVARLVEVGMPEFSLFVSVAMIRPNRNKCLPQLIQTFFESGSYERQLGTLSAGTGLKHIHLEHFRSFLVTIPPLVEQERLFEASRGVIERLTAEEASRDKLKLQKRGLMHDLLTGRVRV